MIHYLKKHIIYNYNINEYIFLSLIFNYLNKKGKKNKSYYFIINVLFELKKKNKKKLPRLIFNYYLNKARPFILLLNKKKGTLSYELPRFITIENSNKKAVEWFIKAARKYNKNIILGIFSEFKNISLNKSEVLNKQKQISDIIIKNKPFFYLLKKRGKSKVRIK